MKILEYLLQKNCNKYSKNKSNYYANLPEVEAITNDA
jgi:hypothetical protein